MIVSRNFERRLVPAVIASVALLLSFASAAHAVDRISVIPGFDRPVNAISEPDSNGTRYLGGSFTSFQPWNTGNGALVGASSGAVNPSFPKVTGNINAAAADGSGGFYIGGDFTCIGPNTSGSCNGADDVVRNRAAHINANGSVDPSWNPNPNSAVIAIAVSGSNVYLGGDFSTVGGIARNYAAAVGTDGALTSWNPNLNNFVTAIAVSGSTVYLGGWFTTVGGTTRNYAAAVGTDGALSTWNPNLGGGVNAIAVSGSNVYLGGGFTTVGGIARNRAAAVGTDGTLTSWNPNLDNFVYAIGVSGSNIYLGGDFSTVGGIARNRAAAVTTDGTLTSWNPDLNNRVNAIGVSGSNVYLGGEFTTVGGIGRNSAAAVGTDGALTAWNPDVNNADLNNPFVNSYVNAIAVSGSNVYLGGQFTTAGGIPRNRAAAVGTDGALTSWNPDVDNTVFAIGVSGSTVYLGGQFNTVGGITRNYAAAVGTNGTLDPSWNPDLNSTVRAIAVSGSNVYLGGYFSTAGGITRNRAAAVGTDGALTSWNPNLNDRVNAIRVSGSNVYLGGWFTTVGGITRNRAAAVGTDGALTSWNPDLDSYVNAIGVSGSTVYLGGDFGTVGGVARNRAAAVGTDGILTSWNPDLSDAFVNNSVRAIGVSGSTVYLGGNFHTVGGIARKYAAAVGTDGTLTSWNPDLNNGVNAIGVSGSNVYLVGWFRTVGGIARNYSAAVGTNGALLGLWPIQPMLLSVTKSGSGSGTVASSPAGIACGTTCSTMFAPGTSVTLTASPAAGSSFTGWSGSGCSGTSTCTVVMSAARAVSAEFAVVPPAFFNLAVSKSGTGAGTVSSSPAGINCGSDCSETLQDGTSVTLTATPATGSSFTGWSGSGCSGTSTCTVVMSAARAVNAAFAVVPPAFFNLAVSKSGTGAGTVTSLLAGINCGSDCSEMLQDGTSVTLTASPAAGSSFTGWSGSCSGISTCTVTMNAARTVTAEFTMPPNVIPTPTVAVGASALVSSVRVPGPGTLTQVVTRSSARTVLTVCKISGKATKAGAVKLSCKLSAATRTALRTRSLRVSVKTTFTPVGGLPASKTQVVTLKRKR